MPYSLLTTQIMPAALAGERRRPMDISGTISWLFSTRDGVIALLVIALVGFLIAAIIMEKKTRKDFDKYDDEDTDSESGWSIFDDDNN